MTDSQKQSTAGRRQMAAFAVVCACVVAARVYLIAVQGDLRSGWRMPDGLVETLALLSIAGLLAAVATRLGLRYFNKTSALLMGIAAGGLTTAGYNGLLGAVPGGLVSFLVVSRTARRTALVLLVGLAAIAFGVVSGTFALWLDPDLSDGPSTATIVFVAVALIAAGAVLFRRRFNATTGGWRWLRRPGKVCLLSFVVAGLWLSLSVDMVRRVWHLTGDPRYLSGVWPVDLRVNPYGRSIGLRPRSGEWLWPGPLRWDGAFLVLREEVTDNDLRALRGWPLRMLTIRGNHVTDVGLSHLIAQTSLCDLQLRSSQITDRGMESVSQFQGLVGLELDRSRVTASGLRRLSYLPNLRGLSLKEVRLTDDEMSVLQLFPDLVSLSLGGTGISDEGLRHLEPLTALSNLDLSSTAVTTRGLPILSVRSFGSLNLSETELSDQHLGVLASFFTVNELNLDRTRVTDAGMPTLAKISGLASLSLVDTEITDVAIPYFESMPSLRCLNLRGTKVTREGAMRLFESKPNCSLGHHSY